MRFFLCLLLLCTSACASAQQNHTTVRSQLKALEPVLDAIIGEEMQSTHLPGVALVVVHNGETVIKRGYGVADLSSGKPVDPDKTLFRIGSVTKALTALALTRAIDDNRVGMNEDVTQYFNKMTNLTGSEEPVTIKHLLTHTGGFDQIGLDRHIHAWERPLAERKAMRPSLAQFLGDNNLRRITPPGQLFRYDTYGITLAGHVLEKTTGLAFPEAMRQEMFEPLGMNKSFVEADEAHINDVAIGYGWNDREYEAQPYEIYVTTPASSIDATAADMGRLLEALTGGGANTHGRLFSKETARTVLAAQYRPHSRFTGITHGMWESPSVDPPDGPVVRSVGHGGSMLGFHTLMEIFTEANVGVFIVTNRNWEAGGGPVNVGQKVNLAILNALYESVPPFEASAAVPAGSRTFAEYTGNYVRGIYCQSCSQEEYMRGAWPRSSPRIVSHAEKGLRIDGNLFLPTEDHDVFVREDKKQEMFFGRDANGAVSFLVSSFGTMSFEKLPD